MRLLEYIWLAARYQSFSTIRVLADDDARVPGSMYWSAGGRKPRIPLSPWSQLSETMHSKQTHGGPPTQSPGISTGKSTQFSEGEKCYRGSRPTKKLSKAKQNAITILFEQPPSRMGSYVVFLFLFAHATDRSDEAAAAEELPARG